MHIFLGMPAEAGPAVKEFFQNLCQHLGFENIPAWPESYDASHSWAAELCDISSHQHVLLTKSDFNDGDVRVRIVPRDANIIFFENAGEASLVTITHSEDRRWKVVMNTPAEGLRLETKLLQALLLLTN